MLEKFFNPKSIAVVGASRTPGKVGHAILQNLKNHFQGKIYPINPFATEILGLKVYPSLKEVPEKVDLAVIAVKAELVEEALKDCNKNGCKNVIIISSGFSEIGREDLEKRIETYAKKHGIRIIGPNCIGIYDTYSGVDTLFWDVKKTNKPKQGYVGFISQSGALGLALLDKYAERGVGISKFVSLGNKIDVQETDLIKYFAKDPTIRVISLYLEGVKDGKEFMKVCKEASVHKPIVILKAGKTEKGKKAVKSHTGSLAGNYEAYRAAFKQSGVIEASCLEELIDFTKTLATRRPMKGDKIAIVTNGGGFGIIATDELVKLGLELAEFEKKTVEKLKTILPEHANIGNPLDLTGDATSERYREALEIVFKDKNVDGVVVISLLQLSPLDEGIVEVLEDMKAFDKPFTVCASGGSYTMEISRLLENKGIPVYEYPHKAIAALGVLKQYNEILKKFKK